MKAIVVTPGQAGSIRMQDVPDPKLGPGEVAVKVLRVGLCGTDVEINNGVYGLPPDGDDYLILGHENFGVVEEVGRKVEGFRAGDFVVATVRRPCGVCLNCRHGENDMCTSGKYRERGIKQRHGYLAEYYVESPGYLNKIPKASRAIGVLLEPMAVVEKGIDHSFILQRRLRWRPKTALVLGSGPVGLLAAAVLRVRGLDTYVAGLDPESDVCARLARKMGARYLCVKNRTLVDVHKGLPPIDLAIEATGVSSVGFDAMQILGPNGVLCLLSVTGGDHTADEPIDAINQRLVLGNQVVFGSVNANPRHFAMGVRDLVKVQKKWPGVLDQMITTRLPWDRYRHWFDSGGAGIKTTLEVA